MKGLLIENGIFDQVDLRNDVEISNGVLDTSIPYEWNDTTTELSCNFNNNVDGGNIVGGLANVLYLELQYKNTNDTQWIKLQTYNIVDPNSGKQTIRFKTVIPYCSNGELYDFRIVPYNTSGIQGEVSQTQVYSKFNCNFIVDSNLTYNITSDFSTSNNKTTQKNAMYEPYGAQYPTIVYNSKTKYDSGSMSTTLLANNNNIIDRKQQVKILEEFKNWITNRKAKIYKDYNGNLKLISIINEIPNSYKKELGNGITTTTFNYVEVGDITEEYLQKLGMLDNFTTTYYY